MDVKLFDSGTWQADLTQLLDEHHLVALSDEPERRARFNTSFCEYLRGLSDTQVIGINGVNATDLAGFANELSRRLRVYDDLTVKPTMDGVIEALRNWPGGVRHRYFVWRDSHVMLDANRTLFSRLVNAMCAVAAEHEHLNPTPLVIQRTVLIGGSPLGVYADDKEGQFHRWLCEEGDAFWEVSSCVDRPKVLIYRLDR